MKPWMNCLSFKRPAVNLANQRALDHEIKGPPHLADGVHAVIDAPGPEAILCRLMTLANQAERVGDRHAHILVANLTVIRRRAPEDADTSHDVHSGRVARHDDLRHPTGLPELTLGSTARHITMKKFAAMPFDVNHL